MSFLVTKIIPVLTIMGTVSQVDALFADETEQPKTVAQIIESYVNDFRSDRFAAQPTLFGIKVPDAGEWHVSVTGERSENGWDVQLGKGPAPTPTFCYKIEVDTLRAIDQGELNALTAQGKAFAGDYTPMSIIQMEGYEPSLEQLAAINPFSFHFWTRGFPEVIPFGKGMTRRAHGSNFVVLYYESGLRTAWYRVEPGERVRDDPREMAMPFPMLVIGMSGTAEGELDGNRVSLPAGNAIFVPAKVDHRWWNETDKPAEAIIVMFGEGA